jgi:hypothetical protein
MHHAVFGECAFPKALLGVQRWRASAFVLLQHVASDSLLELVTFILHMHNTVKGCVTVRGVL